MQYYKIVKKYSDNRIEWQPGEDQIILSDYEEVSHRIIGDFSLPESHTEQIIYSNENQNELEQSFVSHTYPGNTNNNNNTETNQLSDRISLLNRANSIIENQINRLNNVSNRVFSDEIFPFPGSLHNSLNSRFSNPGDLLQMQYITGSYNPSTYNQSPEIFNTNRNLENNTNSNQNNVNNPQKPKKIKLEIPGTVKYVKGTIPETVKEKAKEIEELTELFYGMDSDIKIPTEFECSVMQEIMALPVFDASHPEVQKDPSNRNARHSMESRSFEKLFQENQDQNRSRSYNFLLLNCPVCRHPERGDINRENLLIDTQLQDEILKFLKQHTKN